MPQRKKMQDKFQEETLEETKILGLRSPVGPITFSLAVPRVMVRPQKGTDVLPILNKDFLFLAQTRAHLCSIHSSRMEKNKIKT